MRVPQHLDQVGIDVLDLRRIGVKQQNPVPCSLEQPTVAAFGYSQRCTNRIGNR